MKNKKHQKKLQKAKDLIFEVEHQLRKDNNTVASNKLYFSRVKINECINNIEFNELQRT